MIQLVCAEGDKWRNVMILLLCVEEKQMDECNDTAFAC